MHWAEGPLSWNTNEAPPPSDLKRFYWNSRNLKDCIDNFGRTAIALRNTVERFRDETGSNQFDAGIPDVDKAFARYAKYMDESIVDFHESRRESNLLRVPRDLAHNLDRKAAVIGRSSPLGACGGRILGLCPADLRGQDRRSPA